MVAVELGHTKDDGSLTTEYMLIMAAVNWMVTIIAFVILANFVGKKKYHRPEPTASPLANMGIGGD